jgi:hypothetical protein
MQDLSKDQSKYDLDHRYFLFVKGWIEESPSPNGRAYSFFKTDKNKRKWFISYFKSGTYFSPLEIRYYHVGDNHTLGDYDSWTHPFKFDCKTKEEFDLLSKMLDI